MRTNYAIPGRFVRDCVFAYCASVDQCMYSLSTEHFSRLLCLISQSAGSANSLWPLKGNCAYEQVFPEKLPTIPGLSLLVSRNAAISHEIKLPPAILWKLEIPVSYSFRPGPVFDDAVTSS